MPRTKSIMQKRSWQVRLPEDLSIRIHSELYSQVEGCIPYGKWSEFIETCIREHFNRASDMEELRALRELIGTGS